MDASPARLVLSAEQKAAVVQIGHFFETQRVVVLEGKAGTGKSVIVAELLKDWTSLERRTMVTAISHKSLGQHRETIAAMATSGKRKPPEAVVWAKLNIDAKWWAKVPLGTAKSRAWYNAPAKVPKFLVVEEFGLWTAAAISTLDALLRSTFRARQLPFGGVRVLFVGDEGQIKPRGGEPASTHPLLRRAPHVELKQSRRYRGDPDWGYLLRDLQKPQTPGGLADQLVHKRRVPEPPRDALILAVRRSHVRAAVRAFREKEGVGVRLVPSNPDAVPPEREKDAEDGRFVGGETEGWLVYGCVDMDTNTKRTEDGTLLTNGTEIRFERVETADGEPIEADAVVMGEDVVVVVTLTKTGEEVALQPLELEGNFVVPIRHGTFRPRRSSRGLIPRRRFYDRYGTGHDSPSRGPPRRRRHHSQDTLSRRSPARHEQKALYRRPGHHRRRRVERVEYTARQTRGPP